jgi:hypothetical protein
MALGDRLRALWRFLDECAAEIDPVADLHDRVAALEDRLAVLTAAAESDDGISEDAPSAGRERTDPLVKQTSTAPPDQR